MWQGDGDPMWDVDYDGCAQEYGSRQNDGHGGHNLNFWARREIRTIKSSHATY